MTRLSELVWTGARDALLRELVAAGVSRHDCIEPLAQLPGAPITNHKQIAYRMHALGLRLTTERRREIWGVSIWKERTYSYTPERRAYLEMAYPANVPKDQIMAALAAMDGPPLAGWDAIISYATKIGLRRPPRVRDWAREKERRRRAAAKLYRRRTAKDAAARPPAPKPAPKAPQMAKARKPRPLAAPIVVERGPAIQPSPERADAVTEDRYARARAALAKKKADHAEVARANGLPLREVYRLAGEMRREARA